jgi:hypothetical protein
MRLGKLTDYWLEKLVAFNSVLIVGDKDIDRKPDDIKKGPLVDRRIDPFYISSLRIISP